MRIKLMLISLLLLAIFLILGCSVEVDCEELDEKACLEHQDICSLCPARIVSSSLSCHSLEFCQDIPFE